MRSRTFIRQPFGDAEEARQVMEQRYLRVDQTAQFLGVSRWTVHRLVKDQGIPFIPVRGRIVFDKEDLVSWMRSHKVLPRVGKMATMAA